jgi:2-phosphosulfolactate phosphatase
MTSQNPTSETELDRLDGDWTVEIVQGREPDLPPAAINIVIDVLRAFTTSHVAFEQGASRLELARTVDQAFALAEQTPEAVLAGERDARMVEGFDIGNSPRAFSRLDLEGRPVVHTTTNGVRATTHALEAEEVLVCGWSSAEATLRRCLARAPSLDGRRIHIVASHPVSDEDVACADWLHARLTGRQPPSPPQIRRRIRTARSAQKFYNRDFDIRDLDYACRRLEPRYAMRVDMVDGTPTLGRVAL